MASTKALDPRAIEGLTEALFCRDAAVDVPSTGNHPCVGVIRLALSSVSPACARSLRSVRWRLLLDQLPPNLDSWSAAMSGARESFSKLRASIEPAKGAMFETQSALETGSSSAPCRAPPISKKRFGESGSDEDGVGAAGCRVVSTENPLAPKEGSTYARLFHLQELRRDIEKDITRLAWSDDFFDDSAFLTELSDILTIYCETEGCPYRQGMHEVLAYVYYSVVSDARSLSATLGETGQASSVLVVTSPTASSEVKGAREVGPVTEDVHRVLNVASGVCSTADSSCITFFIFKKLMQVGSEGMGLYSWFQSAPSTAPGANNIVRAAALIQGPMLRAEDAELHAALNETFQIQCASYLLRWLRLLFLREFPHHQCGIVWDAIIADFSWAAHGGDSGSGGKYSLETSVVPHLAVAMLTYLRADLLAEGPVEAQRRLMRFPPVEDIRPIIRPAFATHCSGGSFFGAIAMSCLLEPASEPYDRSIHHEVSQAHNPPIIPSVIGNTRGGMWGNLEEAAPCELSRAASSCRACTGREERERQLGDSVAVVISTLEKKWFASTDVAVTEERLRELDENYLIAIAELKRIRDILHGSIN